jgi:hypothetical protein
MPLRPGEVLVEVLLLDAASAAQLHQAHVQVGRLSLKPSLTS